MSSPFESHCECCGSTRETVLRDAELMGEAEGRTVEDPFCCETIIK